MKLIKISLITALLGSVAFADFNASDKPPMPDYSSIVNNNDSCSEEYINGIVEEQVQVAVAAKVAQCQIDPSLCGIDVDTKITNAKSEQLAKCQNDPASCGIEVGANITPPNISEMSAGWHLLGTSEKIDINSSVDHKYSRQVWGYQSDVGKWLLHSTKSYELEALGDFDSISGQLEVIPANSGYWLLKEDNE